jgi:hypothetical protein
MFFSLRVRAVRPRPLPPTRDDAREVIAVDRRDTSVAALPLDACRRANASTTHQRPSSWRRNPRPENPPRTWPGSARNQRLYRDFVFSTPVVVEPARSPDIYLLHVYLPSTPRTRAPTCAGLAGAQRATPVRQESRRRAGAGTCERLVVRHPRRRVASPPARCERTRVLPRRPPSRR